MMTYFHGWRRKIGVLTLVMACVAAAAWVKPLTCDLCLAEVKGREYRIMAEDHKLSLVRQQLVGIRRREVPAASRCENDNPLFEWRQTWERFGIRLGTGLMFQDRFGLDIDLHLKTISSDVWDIAIVQVPYWAVVVPLSLLSAHLLLINPRIARSTTEHV